MGKPTNPPSLARSAMTPPCAPPDTSRCEPPAELRSAEPEIVRWIVWNPQSVNCSIGETEAKAWEARVLGTFRIMPHDPEYEGCIRDLKANHGWHISEVRYIAPIPSPAEVAALVEAGRKAQHALNVWATVHAPDMCSDEDVAAAQATVGTIGTLAFLADVSATLGAALLPFAAMEAKDDTQQHMSASDPDGAVMPMDTWEELNLSARMIRRWIPEVFPENAAGQVHFVRAICDSVATVIERHIEDTGGALSPKETSDAVQSQQIEDAISAVKGAEQHVIAQKAREWAAHYSQASDGRNTLILFAEWVEGRMQ